MISFGPSQSTTLPSSIRLNRTVRTSYFRSMTGSRYFSSVAGSITALGSQGHTQSAHMQKRKRAPSASREYQARRIRLNERNLLTVNGEKILKACRLLLLSKVNPRVDEHVKDVRNEVPHEL